MWVDSAHLICLLMVGMLGAPVLGQIRLQSRDTLSTGEQSRTIDSLRTDTTPDIAIAEGALDAEIRYGCKGMDDSIVVHYAREEIILEGEAYLEYKDMKLEAARIEIHSDSQLLYAQGRYDSTGRYQRPPVFSSGAQSFTARRLKYHLRNRRGIIYDAITKYEKLYIRSSKTKFLLAEGDSALTNDVLYSADAIFTTCDAPHPHYGVRSTKIKIIPNRLAVIGASRLELGQVRTPLAIPFGFFPIANFPHSGLIFPRDYTYDRALGYGLRNVGYYFKINDYMDFTLMGDIFFNLPISYRIEGQYRYKKRYAFEGELILGYTRHYFEPPRSYEKVPATALRIRYRHAQDPKANPFHHFNGNINIETNNYSRRNDPSAESVATTQYRSFLRYERKFPGKPYSVASELQHSQNTRTGQMTIYAPNIYFSLREIRPLKSLRPGRQWYDDITLTYRARFANRLQMQDTNFTNPSLWERPVYDMVQTLRSDFSMKWLKYINVSTDVQFKEYWHFRRQEIYNVRDTIVQAGDTIIRERIQALTVPRFTPFHEFRSSISMSTNLFGTWQNNRFWLRGLRHKITPSISFNYSPDYTRPEWGYVRTYDADTTIEGVQLRQYSIFLEGATETPRPLTPSFFIRYNIRNNFQAKYFSRRDSSVRKVTLIENLNIQGSYDLTRDSFRFSKVDFSTYATLFKLVKVSARMRMDPYIATVENGRLVRHDRLLLTEGRGLLRFEEAVINFNTSASIRRLYDLIRGKPSGKKSLRQKSRSDRATLFSMVERLQVRHRLELRFVRQLDSVQTSVAHTVSMRGSIPITKNWRVSIGNIGYNFIDGKITYPDLRVYRDLHCWELSFAWQPFRGTYSFFLGVKQGSPLDFIKLPYNQFSALQR